MQEQITSQISPKKFENYKKVRDTIKLPNCKYAISNVIIRKNKPNIEKVIEFNSRLSTFCSKNKLDIIENENLDESCPRF